MKKLLFSLIFLACAGGAAAQTNNCPVSTAPWNCRQGSQNFINGGGVTTISATTATNIANGSLIVVVVGACWNNTCTSGTGTIAVTDGSNTYTCPVNDNLTGVTRTACYVCNSVGGPLSVTATMSPAATSFFPNITWTEITNSNGAIPPTCLDQKSGTTFTSGTGTSAAISTSSPTTKNNDLIWSEIGGASTIATNNSFQYLVEGGSLTVATEMKNGATPGTYATGWTFASSTWAGVEFAFFGPASNSGVARHHGTWINFTPRHHRIPWAFRPNRMRVDTI